MVLTRYDEKTNTLLINSGVISPNTKGMKLKDQFTLKKEAFNKSYTERLSDYATEEQRKKIYEEMDRHPGCSISEFMDI